MNTWTIEEQMNRERHPRSVTKAWKKFKRTRNISDLKRLRERCNSHDKRARERWVLAEMGVIV